MKNVLVLVLCLLFNQFSFAAESPPAAPPIEQPAEKLTTPAPSPTAPDQEIHSEAKDAYAATDSYESAFMKMLAALGLLLVLLLLSFWAFRRLSRGRYGTWASGSALKILEKRALSQKSMLYILEYKGKKILVSESQFEVRSLVTLEESIPEE